VEYALTLLPVLLFLLVFYLMDSFKLVHTKILATVFLSGCIAALIAYLLNSRILSSTKMEFEEPYVRYIAPLIEELLKAAVILVLIKRKKIGFLIDAAIYGFASGAGFAVSENIYYLFVTPDPDLAFWTLRGFGTAIMHSGTTALLAILSVGALNSGKKFSAGLVPGLLLAYITHSVFNHFYVHPIIQTFLILIIVPALLMIIFKFNEIQLQKWLEIEFFSEAELLSKMKKGEFSVSKSGKYLAVLKEHFSAETIVDMYCYITLYLELSIKSKRNLMLSECGLPVLKEPGLAGKIKEFEIIRKSIGKTGELALSPFFKMKQRDFWQMSRLSANSE